MYTLRKTPSLSYLLNSFCNSRRNRQRDTEQLPTYQVVELEQSNPSADIYANNKLCEKVNISDAE